MKIYVESKDLLNELGHFNDTIQLEEACKEAGLHFEQDDMYNCYVSKNADCECFEEIEV